MKKIYLTILTVLLSAMPFAGYGQAVSGEGSKPRVLITTDPELDDLNSLLRVLLFSTDFRIEGLVYSSSEWHWKGDGKGTKWYTPNREFSRDGADMGPVENWRWAEDNWHIDWAVDAYEEAYENLRVHNPDYPTPEFLRSKIRIGNVEFEGEMEKDTPGSELIKQVLLDDDPQPVYVQTWGGANTVARALKSIQEIYEGTPQWEEIHKKVSEKCILCMSGDQDETYPRYIHPYWPEIRRAQFSYSGTRLGYSAQSSMPEEDQLYYSPDYVLKYFTVGPLGALYRYWGDGVQMVPGDIYDAFGVSAGKTGEQLRAEGYVEMTYDPFPQGSFLGEGDTGCFINFIGNGLRGHEDLSYGAWLAPVAPTPYKFRGTMGDMMYGGGNLAEMMAAMYQTSSEDEEAPRPQRAVAENPLPDFTPAIFNGEAARFLWSVTPKYEDANHEPEIEGELSMSGAPGETLKLKYTVTDPDKDAVSVSWWQYKPACTYKGETNVKDTASASTTYTVPADAQSGQTIHLVLEATDNGEPQLNHYLRLIITVK